MTCLDISLILQAAKALEFCSTEPCSPIKTCACPTSRWKKSPELATKHQWFDERGTYMSEAESQGNKPSHIVVSRQVTCGSLSAREEGEIASY